MGCEKFTCRQEEFCDASYNCEGGDCACYGACEHCAYEDDEYECPVAQRFEQMCK